MNPTLDIVIVNWNAGRQLHDCLESIASVARDGFTLRRVVLVDNGSSDDSIVGLDSYALPLDLIRNSVNQGFGAACNQGAALCDSQFILFLNPDTVLLEHSLTAPLAFMDNETNKDVGICGIQLIDEMGEECLSHAKFPCLGDVFLHIVGFNRFGNSRKEEAEVLSGMDGMRLVDQVIGAFFLVRYPVFESLGGFDEQFFVYFEEVDFSLRARNIGWSSMFLTAPRCIHIGGGCSRQVKAARLFYSLRSRILYGFKHFNVVSAITLFVITLSLEFISRLLFSIMSGSWESFKHVVQGYAMLFRDMPAILMKASRRRIRDSSQHG